jgi:hypothetical protein
MPGLHASTSAGPDLPIWARKMRVSERIANLNVLVPLMGAPLKILGVYNANLAMTLRWSHTAHTKDEFQPQLPCKGHKPAEERAHSSLAEQWELPYLYVPVWTHCLAAAALAWLWEG